MRRYVPHDGVFYDQKQKDGVAKSLTLPDGQIVPASSKVQVVVDDAALARWPSNGNIRFEDVWMQYRLDAPWALKGVTFSIKDGEKVRVRVPAAAFLHSFVAPATLLACLRCSL